MSGHSAVKRSTPYGNRAGPHPIGPGAPARRVVNAALGAALGGLVGRLWATPRAILHVIGTLADQNTGCLPTTAAQLADLLGCDRRTAAMGLWRLESVGLISWTRGGVVDGRPAVGVVRLDKTALCDLIPAGLDWLAKTRLARAAATAARLVGLVAVDNARRGRQSSARRAKRAGQPYVQRTATSSPTEDYRPLKGPPVPDWRATQRNPDPQIAIAGAAAARQALADARSARQSMR